MEPARQELETAIKNTRFSTPVCPIYQNVDAQPYTDPAKIQENLIAQLTASVRWTPVSYTHLDVYKRQHQYRE